MRWSPSAYPHGLVKLTMSRRTQFRMLAFNLEKPDRVSLRHSIGIGKMMPAELSVMSNSELASDQQKKEIETAQKESLEHSILDGRQLNRPLRKITHKGEEEIEDMDRDDETARARGARRSSNYYFPSASNVERAEPRTPALDDSRLTILNNHALVTSAHSISGGMDSSEDNTLATQSTSHPSSPSSTTIVYSPTTATQTISTMPLEVAPSSVASPTSRRFDLSSLGWAEDDHVSVTVPLEHESSEELADNTPVEAVAGEDTRSDHDFSMFIEPESHGIVDPVYHEGSMPSMKSGAVWSGEVCPSPDQMSRHR